MFFDIGSLEFITLVILAILVFGPEKLPKMIQDCAQFVRKIRDFSDSAKRDIRSELGPEFKDFEFEDLNPRRFAKKHLMGDDELGLKELKELTSDLDVRKELTDVTDAVNGRTPSRTASAAGRTGTVTTSAAAGDAAASRVSLAKDDPAPAQRQDDPPPFDADAT